MKTQMDKDNEPLRKRQMARPASWPTHNIAEVVANQTRWHVKKLVYVLYIVHIYVASPLA